MMNYIAEEQNPPDLGWHS